MIIFWNEIKKNKYQKFSKISEPQFRQILRLFALDLTASDTARLTGISVRSINTLFLKLRQRLAAECEQQTPFDGVVELDESYFGAKRIRGKRGRGAGGKTIVFGVLKRGDKVYTEIVSDAPKATLQKVIRGHISIESVINTDGWRGFIVWLIWGLQSILGCITGKMSLLVERNTLTVLSRFGVMRNTIWYTTWCSKTYVLLASERNWISLQSQAWWFVQSTAENVAEWSFKMIFAS